jgi:N-acetylglucosaminyldiphosphoundecaprenol N-acetyl-beta-D-mannosaminyltransferase
MREPALDVPARSVVGMRVDAVTYASVTRTIAGWARARQSRYVCVASVNNVVLSRDDPLFLEAMNNADVTTPDGVPLVWALRLLGVKAAERVTGPVLMDVICEEAARAGIRVGLYGSTEEVVSGLRARLPVRHPGLEITFAEAPPFRPLSEEELSETRSRIGSADVGILFVGLGAPKQERWMADNTASLPCVMVGVGAAFDVLAGRTGRPPAWMQSLGLEWTYRLVHEPQRLWRRYLIGNPRFVALFARQLIRRRYGTEM